MICFMNANEEGGKKPEIIIQAHLLVSVTEQALVCFVASQKIKKNKKK